MEEEEEAAAACVSIDIDPEFMAIFQSAVNVTCQTMGANKLKDAEHRIKRLEEENGRLKAEIVRYEEWHALFDPAIEQLKQFIQRSASSSWFQVVFMKVAGVSYDL